MGWIVGLVVVVGFVWLMVSSRSFRRFGFGLIGLVAAAVAVFWALERKEHERFMEELVREKSAIPHTAVELRGLQLSGGTYRSVTGTVINHSAYPIKSITLQVSIRDCPSMTSEAGCTIIGQDNATAYVDVPPGQARQFNASVDLQNAAAPVGHWGWVYGLKEVVADLS